MDLAIMTTDNKGSILNYTKQPFDECGKINLR